MFSPGSHWTQKLSEAENASIRRPCSHQTQSVTRHPFVAWAVEHSFRRLLCFVLQWWAILFIFTGSWSKKNENIRYIFKIKHFVAHVTKKSIIGGVSDLFLKVCLCNVCKLLCLIWTLLSEQQSGGLWIVRQSEGGVFGITNKKAKRVCCSVQTEDVNWSLH